MKFWTDGQRVWRVKDESVYQWHGGHWVEVPLAPWSFEMDAMGGDIYWPLTPEQAFALALQESPSTASD